MTKQDFIEMIENLPDDAELVVSNYTITQCLQRAYGKPQQRGILYM